MRVAQGLILAAMAFASTGLDVDDNDSDADESAAKARYQEFITSYNALLESTAEGVWPPSSRQQLAGYCYSATAGRPPAGIEVEAVSVLGMSGDIAVLRADRRLRFVTGFRFERMGPSMPTSTIVAPDSTVVVLRNWAQKGWTIQKQDVVPDWRPSLPSSARVAADVVSGLQKSLEELLLLIEKDRDAFVWDYLTPGRKEVLADIRRLGGLAEEPVPYHFVNRRLTRFDAFSGGDDLVAAVISCEVEAGSLRISPQGSIVSGGVFSPFTNFGVVTWRKDQFGRWKVFSCATL